MSDIVERLRDPTTQTIGIYDEAADYIERLEEVSLINERDYNSKCEEIKRLSTEGKNNSISFARYVQENWHKLAYPSQQHYEQMYEAWITASGTRNEA